MKFFIDEKRKHLSNDVDDVVVNEFDYEQSIKSIVLHVIAILTKLTSYILIDSLNLIVDFEMKSRWKFALDVKSFTKKLSNQSYELKVSIENYKWW